MEATLGAALFLLFCGSLVTHGPSHRFTPAEQIACIVVLGAVSMSLLWAGLSLMFGWRSRRKAQALLWAVGLSLGLVFFALRG